MSIAKRLAILSLTLALLGTSACADASGPQAETCPEGQGVGGRSCQ